MITLRDVASPLLERELAAGMRAKLSVLRARRDGEGTVTIAKNHNLSVIHENDVKPTESGELFILGSGPSALDISPTLKRRMRAGITIGLNSWVLHDFIPDIYSFEQMESDDYDSVAAGLSKVLLRPEILDAQPLLLHLRPKVSTPANRLVSIPEALRQRTRYYGRFTVETRRIANLIPDLTRLLFGSVSHEIPNYVFLDSGLSVARMMHLGILREFKSIILVGVDLNSNKYFFEENPSYLQRHGLSDFNPWMSRGNSHDTEERTNRHFVASEFILALARASKNVGGPEIFVTSVKSKLSSELSLLV